jgi:hypothetical protein
MAEKKRFHNDPPNPKGAGAIVCALGYDGKGFGVRSKDGGDADALARNWREKGVVSRSNWRPGVTTTTKKSINYLFRRPLPRLGSWFEAARPNFNIP